MTEDERLIAYIVVALVGTAISAIVADVFGGAYVLIVMAICFFVGDLISRQ